MVSKFLESVDCNYVDFADQIYVYFFQLRSCVFWTQSPIHATQMCSNRHLCIIHAPYIFLSQTLFSYRCLAGL